MLPSHSPPQAQPTPAFLFPLDQSPSRTLLLSCPHLRAKHKTILRLGAAELPVQVMLWRSAGVLGRMVNLDQFSEGQALSALLLLSNENSFIVFTGHKGSNLSGLLV